MHGLHWYDYGARHYDPAIMRFTTMDPMCEKYYHLSPYAYCGNNPVNYVDENGDSLSLAGEKDDINTIVNIYNKGMGGYYKVSVDNNGVVSINQNKSMDPNNMSQSERIMYNQLNRIISSKNMTNISIVNNCHDVIIGRIENNSIDVSDILALDEYVNTSSAAALLHETIENFLVQNPNFRIGDVNRIAKAHGSAESIEHVFTGNLNVKNVLELDDKKTGYLLFILNENSIEKIHIIRGNILK